MSFLSTFAITLGFLIGSLSVTSSAQDFRPDSLSEPGQKAYENLLHANRFEGSNVGYSGTLSVYVKNLDTLLDESNADAAFKSLVKNGEMAGQLYGLIGLFYTDHDSFQKVAERYRKSDHKVEVLSGCIGYTANVSDIVESKAENVAIIGPGESLEQYLAGNNRREFNIDIINGGYPAIFRYAVQK